jgi:hypothetical protein
VAAPPVSPTASWSTDLAELLPIPADGAPGAEQNAHGGQFGRHAWWDWLVDKGVILEEPEPGPVLSAKGGAGLVWRVHAPYIVQSHIGSSSGAAGLEYARRAPATKQSPWAWGLLAGGPGAHSVGRPASWAPSSVDPPHCILHYL